MGDDSGRLKATASSYDSLWEGLPESLWWEIFARLECDDRRALEPVSLACKRLLLFSNRFRTSFSASSGAKVHVPIGALCARFSQLTSISLRGPDPGLDAAVTQLAHSNLRLQSLRLAYYQTHLPKDAMQLLGRNMSKTLTSLACVGFQSFTDDDVFIIAGCFSYLHHLNLEGVGHRVTEVGIDAISSKLKSLVALNVSLDRNCGVYLDRFLPFSSLTALELDNVRISESALVQLSTANLKLRRLTVFLSWSADDISGATLVRFLKSCKSLCYLKLVFFLFPADLTATDFAASIPNIQAITFDSGKSLPESTLVHLLKSCPNLQYINLDCKSIGFPKYWLDIPVNKLMQGLVLYQCGDLCDEALEFIISICPNLKSVYLFGCHGITEDGIETIKAKIDKLIFY